MSVVAGSRCGRHSGKREAGIRSSSQDFKDISLSVFAISVSETGWKKKSGVSANVGSGRGHVGTETGQVLYGCFELWSGRMSTTRPYRDCE